LPFPLLTINGREGRHRRPLPALAPLGELREALGAHDDSHDAVPIVDELGLFGRETQHLREVLLGLGDLPVHGVMVAHCVSNMTMDIMHKGDKYAIPRPHKDG
jgi:hypothetical protein